jgi:ectoine hydroxylase-related dioxygenase (phytanoyl-CoA dioxygenase family)
VPESLIDEFVSDIRSTHQHPGMFVRTDHRANNPRLVLSDDRPDRYESLFDLYANLESSRAVCLHPKVSRFLEVVFDAKPLAFQQLLFQRSNGHQIHQDTSVVAVENPLWLAASWIALQDVQEGSGELAFYDRSHKLPHYLFKDGSKRFRHDLDDRAEYEAELARACAGLPYERFLAKKGDVFLWAADLVHRSHPRSMPDDTNRMSCVTHYCPATTEPFWFRFHPDNRAVRPYRSLGSFASSFYRLPERRGRMLRPNRDL